MQQICSGNSSALINLTSNETNTIFSWTVIHSGTITGFISNGTNQIPIELLTNTGTSIDSVIYHISTLANNCQGNLTDYKIIVSPLPNASFVQPVSGCQPLTVLFQNQSTPTILNYLWDFGNGQVSNLQNPLMDFINLNNIFSSLRNRIDCFFI